MTRIKPDERVCSVCGKKSVHYALLSTNTFGGGPDLDGRPGEMMRSTMGMWIQECPVCGVVAYDLEDECPVTEQWLKQKSYKKCDGIKFASGLAKRFYRHYKILSYADDREGAFQELRCAAWACDDVGDTKNARHCRLLALELLEQLMKETDFDEEQWVVKADFLRRTKQFDAVIKLGGSVSLQDKHLNQLLSYEVQKAYECDSACYCTDDVTEVEEMHRMESESESAELTDEEWQALMKCLFV